MAKLREKAKMPKLGTKSLKSFFFHVWAKPPQRRKNLKSFFFFFFLVWALSAAIGENAVGFLSRSATREATRTLTFWG